MKKPDAHETTSSSGTLASQDTTVPEIRPNVCIITTVDSSMYVLFPDLFPLLQKKGFAVTAICADGPWLEKVRAQGIRVIVVPMKRDFAVASDLKCLWKLYRIFKREKFDLIHYNTPKAALLAGLAGRMVGCRALLYTLRGLGYTAFGGLKREVGKLCEKAACRCAHNVIAISNSLKTEAVREGLLAADRIKVLGAGSSRGVDLEKFRINNRTMTAAKNIRQQLGIGESDVVIGYAGRMTEEKGIIELAKAFMNLKAVHSNLHLIMMGHLDQRKPLEAENRELLERSQGIHLLSFKDNVSDYLAAMDILVLPSYREGFGNSLIEASAMGLPVVATDIIGCRDAVINGKTGILVNPREIKCLEDALAWLIDSPASRKTLGENGRQWVTNNFDRRTVWARLIEVYEQKLATLLEP